MFPPVDKNESFPQRELDVLRFWKDRDTYRKTLAAREGAPPFVFYEGPPTANGMPHPGHCLTRAIKDLFPRYKTMRGYRCERKAGWDTHGLPVETEVAKDLPRAGGLHSKEDIEEYGIEPFIHKCQESVWRYMKRVGTPHRADRLLGRSQERVRHVPPELHRERVVVAEEAVRPRAAVQGAQDRLVVGPGRDGAIGGRGGARVSRGGGSERVCEVSAG